MNKILLLSAICSAKGVTQQDLTAPVVTTPPVSDGTTPTVDTTQITPESTLPEPTTDDKIPGGGEDFKIPVQDSFKVMGPINGVCSSEFNSHPMVMKDPLDTQTILGQWKTALVDEEVLKRMFVPLCMIAEFEQLDGQEEIVMRVGELHSLKDDVA